MQNGLELYKKIGKGKTYALTFWIEGRDDDVDTMIVQAKNYDALEYYLLDILASRIGKKDAEFIIITGRWYAQDVEEIDFTCPALTPSQQKNLAAHIRKQAAEYNIA